MSSKRRGWFKYLFFTGAVVSWIGALLSPFILLPPIDWLIGSYFFCSFLLSFSLLNAVVRRRWRDALIIAALLSIVFSPFYGPAAPAQWLRVVAFRYHTSPIDQYLSRCRLIGFVENGVKQRLGRCESFNYGRETYLQIYYDSSGEFVLPAAQRSAEWKSAMAHFSPHAVLIEKDGRADRIFADFYVIVISPDELDGDDEKYEN